MCSSIHILSNWRTRLVFRRCCAEWNINRRNIMPPESAWRISTSVTQDQSLVQFCTIISLIYAVFRVTFQRSVAGPLEEISSAGNSIRGEFCQVWCKNRTPPPSLYVQTIGPRDFLKSDLVNSSCMAKQDAKVSALSHASSRHQYLLFIPSE